jgi:hypothetical protein
MSKGKIKGKEPKEKYKKFYFVLGIISMSIGFLIFLFILIVIFG